MSCFPEQMAHLKSTVHWFLWCPNLWHLKHLSGSALYCVTLKVPQIPKLTVSGIAPMKVVRMAVVRFPYLFFMRSAVYTLEREVRGSSGRAIG